MEVKNEIETVDYRVLSTEKFVFKIKEETLDKMLENKHYATRIAKYLMRAMKPMLTAENITGIEWQESYDLILKTLLDMRRN